MSDSEQCSNQLEFDLISIVVNFSCELGQIGGSFEREKNPKMGAKILIRFYILGEKCFFFAIQNLIADFGDIALCSNERRVV